MAAPSNEYLVTHCSAVILAAGQSARLGSPKQLLFYKGKNLLQHAIDTAKQASVQSITVVLGSNFELLVNRIDTTGLHIVKNEDWQTGVASSICCGINSLKDITPLPDAAIFMVCDQPFVTASLLDELLAVQKATKQSIVASEYEDTIGIPALFHKSVFTQLLELKGNTGAKKVMQQHPDSVATVPFPLGSIDIDTLDDYERLAK